MKKLLSILLMITCYQVNAGSPLCNGPGETKVSWPTVNPIWELCYLRPSQSSAEQGSSLEIRDAYYNGHYVLERAHIPMLFANYTSSTCYRDWKDADSDFLRADTVENPSRPAITTCDVSVSETQPVFDCPFQDVSEGGSGNVGSASDCMLGVQVEKYDDRLLLTTNHSAAWYKYSSRYTFYADGRIQPRFGFGNSNGTSAGTTHWHHAYWRVNFDIDGPENDLVYSNNDIMEEEFIGFRNQRPEQSWAIIDSVTQRGYRIRPTAEDYLVGTDPSGAGYHEVDVMATKYKLFNQLPEYSDTPGSNNLGNCVMNENALVNGESLIDEDVVFWYRTAVHDIANMGLVCKFGGPIFYPIGDWSPDIPIIDLIFKQGFDL
jgi:hypothetical protein